MLGVPLLSHCAPWTADNPCRVSGRPELLAPPPALCSGHLQGSCKTMVLHLDPDLQADQHQRPGTKLASLAVFTMSCIDSLAIQVGAFGPHGILTADRRSCSQSQQQQHAAGWAPRRVGRPPRGIDAQYCWSLSLAPLTTPGICWHAPVCARHGGMAKQVLSCLCWT